jgi:hypothetical protein
MLLFILCVLSGHRLVDWVGVDVRIFLIVVLWVAGLLPPAQVDDLTPGYWEQTPLPHTGLATFYAAGMMEHVLDVRAGHGQALRCDECVGTVALLRAGDIGRKVWLQPPGGERAGPFLVIDCARREDIPPLVARNWAVDVSFEVGQLWGMDRPLAGVTVLADPASEGAAGWIAAPMPAPTRFFVPPDKVVVSAPTPTPRISPTPWQPTPWPTRLPAALGPAAPPPASGTPIADQPPAVAAGPTPLTPIVATPTPRVSARPTATPAVTAPSGAPPAATFAPEQEIAVGRPGGGLLEPAGAWPGRPAVTPASAPAGLRPTATPSSPLRRGVTPSVTSPPILPRTTVTPAPSAADDGGLLGLFRLLLGLTRP